MTDSDKEGNGSDSSDDEAPDMANVSDEDSEMSSGEDPLDLGESDLGETDDELDYSNFSEEKDDECIEERKVRFSWESDCNFISIIPPPKWF